MNYYNIPIFVISYNRKNDLCKCVEKLSQDGYLNINIIDNASDDVELIKYLKKVEYKVYFLEKNWGHKVFWECGLFDKIIESEYYVVTDPDIIPIEKCPTNYIEFFYEVLMKYPMVTKVGFSLKIDDLPVENKRRMDVVRAESFFYDKVVCDNPLLYDADIDTTFALYRPGKIQNFFSAIRTGYPYEARHLPWYWNSNKLNNEQEEYLKKGSVYGNTYVAENKIRKLNFSVMKSVYNKPELNLGNWKLGVYVSFSKLHSKLYIYGAGKIGVEVGNLLSENGIIFEGYVVTEIDNNKNKQCNGHEVISIQELCKMNQDEIGIIIATSFEYQMQILPNLYKKGFKSICAVEM